MSLLAPIACCVFMQRMLGAAIGHVVSEPSPFHRSSDFDDGGASRCGTSCGCTDCARSVLDLFSGAEVAAPTTASPDSETISGRLLLGAHSDEVAAIRFLSMRPDDL